MALIRILSPLNSTSVFNEGSGFRIENIGGHKLLAYDIYLDGIPIASYSQTTNLVLMERETRRIGDGSCYVYSPKSNTKIEDFRFFNYQIGHHLLSADVYIDAPFPSESTAPCTNLGGTGIISEFKIQDTIQHINVVPLDLAQEISPVRIQPLEPEIISPLIPFTPMPISPIDPISYVPFTSDITNVPITKKEPQGNTMMVIAILAFLLLS